MLIVHRLGLVAPGLVDTDGLSVSGSEGEENIAKEAKNGRLDE